MMLHADYLVSHSHSQVFLCFYAFARPLLSYVLTETIVHIILLLLLTDTCYILQRLCSYSFQGPKIYLSPALQCLTASKSIMDKKI